MLRRVTVALVILLVLAIPTPALAIDAPLNGKVYSIEEGEKAPYAGILLDPIAAAQMITNKKYLRAEVELELRKEFQKGLVDKSLALELLQLEHDSYKSLNENILSIRETEISQLNAALREEMTDYSHWWFAGGVVTGILLSIGILYAVTEIGTNG